MSGEALRRAFEAPGNRGMAEGLCQYFSRAWGISPGLGYVMPAGFESAHASYDPEGHCIHLNPDLLEASRTECAYYVLHELCHAWQYLRPQDFPEAVVRSLNYAVGYNGQCHKRESGGWKSCVLDGPEAYFTDIYLAQPHELDAGEFAYRTIKPLVHGDEAAELEALFRFWRPAYQLVKEGDMPGELNKVFARIDAKTE